MLYFLPVSQALNQPSSKEMLPVGCSPVTFPLSSVVVGQHVQF